VHINYRCFFNWKIFLLFNLYFGAELLFKLSYFNSSWPSFKTSIYDMFYMKVTFVYPSIINCIIKMYIVLN
jgi:hypothetical protein